MTRLHPAPRGWRRRRQASQAPGGRWCKGTPTLSPVHAHARRLSYTLTRACRHTRSPACVPVHLVLLGPVMLAGTSLLVQAQPGCDPRSLHTRQRHLPENDPRCSPSLTSPASPPAKGHWGQTGGAARGDNSPVCVAFKYSATPSRTLAFHGPTGRRQPGSRTHLTMNSCGLGKEEGNKVL